MKHQLTKEITKEFKKRSHVVFNYQHRRFNKIMSHIQDQNRVAGQRKSNGDRNRVRRAYPSSERWFKQRMKDYRRKSRVDFKCEWSSRHNAMRKVHRQRELSDLNQCYRRHYSDNPWVGKTSTEIQQQYWEHKMSVQDKVKKLGRPVVHQDGCGSNAKLPGQTLVAELPDIPLLDNRTHSGLKLFASREMQSMEFSLFNTMFRRNFSNEAWVKTVLQHPAACVMNTEDSYSIIWDSGASMCILNNKADF